MRYVSSWQHPHTTSRKMLSTGEPPYGVCFKCGKLPLGKKLPLLQLQTEHCPNWAKKEQEVKCLTLPGLHRDEDPHASCFEEQSVRCSGPAAWKHGRPKLPDEAWWPCSSRSLCVLQSYKLLVLHFLSVLITLILLRSLMGLTLTVKPKLLTI